MLHDLYAVLWLATWGNNTAWLESLLVMGAVAFWKRDRIGRQTAAWWAKHHGPHAIEHHREALRQHEEAKASGQGGASREGSR